MAEKFGPLLKKWRNLSDLTQTGLVEELRVGLENERYSKSDISKWEHGKIPAEDIVEQLEKILSIPEGLLLRAAHYSRAAEYRRSLTREELEEVDTERELSLQWQQMEHIKGLQELARSVRAYFFECPDIPKPEDIKRFDLIYHSLIMAFSKLTEDAYWPSLAFHLGVHREEWEEMADELLDSIDFPMPWEVNLLVPDSYAKRAIKAWFLINRSGLITMASSGSTSEWERGGLSSKCPFCPIQTAENVDMSD